MSPQSAYVILGRLMDACRIHNAAFWVGNEVFHGQVLADAVAAIEADRCEREAERAKDRDRIEELLVKLVEIKIERTKDLEAMRCAAGPLMHGTAKALLAKRLSESEATP